MKILTSCSAQICKLNTKSRRSIIYQKLQTFGHSHNEGVDQVHMLGFVRHIQVCNRGLATDTDSKYGHEGLLTGQFLHKPTQTQYSFHRNHFTRLRITWLHITLRFGHCNVSWCSRCANATFARHPANRHSTSRWAHNVCLCACNVFNGVCSPHCLEG